MNSPFISYMTEPSHVNEPEFLGWNNRTHKSVMTLMERNASKTEGLVSFILGVISIFYMSPVFVPLAIVLGIVALFKKQFVWGVLGILCAIVGLITSPILLTALGLTVIALETHSFRHDNKPRHPIQRPATEIKVPSPKIRLIHVPFTPTSLLQSMTVFLLSGLIFLLAGFIQGLTGFGAGLVAIPLLCMMMDAKLAVPLSILSGLVITTTMAYELRRFLDWRKIMPLLVGSIPGVFAGTVFLKQADPVVIHRILGLLLISISVFNLSIKPKPIKPPLIWGYVAGFLSGSLTASVGAGGPPAIIYTTLHDWKKEEIKATLTGFFVLNGYLTAAVHASNGMITRSTLDYFVFTLFFVVLGTFAGSAMSSWIQRRTYLRIVYVLLMGLGILMLAR